MKKLQNKLSYVDRLSARREGQTDQQDLLLAEENLLQLKSDMLEYKKKLIQARVKLENLLGADKLDSAQILDQKELIGRLEEDLKNTQELVKELFPNG